MNQYLFILLQVYIKELRRINQLLSIGYTSFARIPTKLFCSYNLFSSLFFFLDKKKISHFMLMKSWMEMIRLQMLEEGLGMPHMSCGDSDELNNNDKPNWEVKAFYKLLKNVDIMPFSKFTKFSKLSFLMKLLHLKCRNRWSNKSFTDLNSWKNHF